EASLVLSFRDAGDCGLARSSSVERSARPCPRPSAWARVILRWRHASSTRCRSYATPSRKGCRRRVRCGALAPDHAQLAAATSVEVQCCPPLEPCQAGDDGRLRFAFRFRCKGVYRPEQQVGIRSGTLLALPPDWTWTRDPGHASWARGSDVAAGRHGLLGGAGGLAIRHLPGPGEPRRCHAVPHASRSMGGALWHQERQSPLAIAWPREARHV